MPTFADCFKLEEAKPPRSLRLISSGNFFRAYNKSAWYFTSLIADYKVTRKYVKAISQDVYYIGCPREKLLDVCGGQPMEKTDFGFDLKLSEEKIPQDESQYEEWKQHANEYTGVRTLGKEDEQEVMRSVCQQIREWPIESKTMMETLTFFSKLRTQLNRQTEQTDDGTLL